MRFLFILIFVTTQSCSIFASDTQTIKPDDTFWDKRKKELASPWTTSAKPWLVYGTIATLTFGYPLEDSIVDPTQEETVENRPLGDLSKIGDYGGRMYPNAFYALGMGAHYLATGNENSYNSQTAMIVASAYAVGTSSILKAIVREPRPNNNNDKSSFPSGHTTAAFAFSSTVVAQHGMWPWGAAASALAILTACSRINDNKHYLHDVVGGFTIGSAFGFGISDLYKVRADHSKATKDSASARWNLFPIYSDRQTGLVAVRYF